MEKFKPSSKCELFVTLFKHAKEVTLENELTQAQEEIKKYQDQIRSLKSLLGYESGLNIAQCDILREHIISFRQVLNYARPPPWSGIST